MSHTTSGAVDIIPESSDEDLPEDRQPGVINVKDLSYTHDDRHLPTPSLSPSHHPGTPDSEEELHSPPSQLQQKAYTPSPLHASDKFTQLSLNDPVGPTQSATASVAPTQGSQDMETPAAYPASTAHDSYFPFPNYRPLTSGTSSPSPQQGMTVPPFTGGTVTPMSRNVSAASVTDHKSPTAPNNLHEATHADHPPPAPSAGTRTSRSSSSAAKPAMLGAIGEKKSFFHKMFHHEGKDKHDKLDVPLSEGRASPRNVSPNSPNRDGAYSPPLTPGTSDSDRSRPPSRAPSVKRGASDVHDPHAQPPTDGRATPSLQRRLSGRSASHCSTGPGNVAAPAPIPGPAVKKPEAARTPSIFGKKEDGGGTKFTLKDLVGLGDNGPKLNRRPSAAGSGKGSDRGSTKGSERDYGDNGSTASLLKKYGICDKAAIGKGATAVVRLAHKWDRREEKLYAVKEFRKRRKNETEKDYVKKLTSEFCISSTLHHMNIVETVDLVQDEQHHWCEVMEYCPGGDLYAAIKKGGMSSGEVECTFKQILLGIQYLHGMGVAHRDIKPENLLLDGRGHVKITDFGVSDVFRMCWEKKTHLSKGLCGSEPYIAPELFDHKEYDARQVDVWAAAVVFYCMQFQELPWRVAKPTDTTFATYLQAFYPPSNKPTDPAHPHPTPPPLNNLVPRECRTVIKHMLDPDPKTRWSIDEALKDKWLMGIEVCVEGEVNGHSHTTAGMEIVKV